MRPNVATYRTVEDNLPGLIQQNPAYQQQRHLHRPHSHQSRVPPLPSWSNHHGPGFNGNYSCVPHNLIVHAAAGIPNNCLQTSPNNLPSNTHHNLSSNGYNHVNDPHASPFGVAQRNTANNKVGSYMKLASDAVNLQRINDCAGIPLISTASVHLASGNRQRVQRKNSNSPPDIHRTRNAAFNWHMQHYGRVNGIPPVGSHGQAMPLIAHKGSNINNNWSTAKAPRNSLSTRSIFPSFSSNGNIYQLENGYINPALQQSRPQEGCITNKEKSAMQQEQINHNHNHNHNHNQITQRDLTEASLPRIIKPRKRRKKDRKPTNTMLIPQDDTSIAKHEFELELCKIPQQSNQIPNTQFNASNVEAYDSNNDNFAAIFKMQMTAKPAHICTNNNISTYINKIESIESDHNKHGVCFCQNCDPLRRIWDYPLRRSFSDSSATSASDQSSTSSSLSSTSSNSSRSSVISQPSQRTRADIVGVIGSNRISNEVVNSAPPEASKFVSGCQSDSNDSGFGDILGGINLAEDILSTSFVENQRADTRITAPLTTTSSLLKPETAESLLNESINEISRKLLETCSGASGCETNDFSEIPQLPSCTFTLDDVLGSAELNSDELMFNFDQLSISKTYKNNEFSKLNAHQTHFLFPPTNELLQLDLNNDDEEKRSSDQKFLNQQYNYSNCFDMVWHNLNASARSGNSLENEIRSMSTRVLEEKM